MTYVTYVTYKYKDHDAPPMNMRTDSTVDGTTLRRLAEQVQGLRDRTVAEVAQVVVGMEHVTRQFLIALLGAGHVLLEGVPGVAKTTLSKTFAQVLGIQYQRVQFTPDLLPSDVTGTYVFDRKQNEFVLRKGPIFTQVLLADEINRAPAKTQRALLEAMQEVQVTIEGTTLQLPQPFMVLATQNPVEQEGVYRLPEAQLDRFLLRVDMGYPEPRGRSGHAETAQPARCQRGSGLDAGIDPRLAASSRRSLRHRCPARLHRAAGAGEPRASRCGAGGQSAGVAVPAALCPSAALLDGRHYFTHEDVHAIAQGVLGHRIIIRPEAEVEGRRTAEVIQDLLSSVPVLEAD